MPSSFLPNSLSINPIVYSFLSWWCAASRGNGARPFHTVHCIEYALVHNLSTYGWHRFDFLAYHPIFIFLFCVFPPKNFLCRARKCLSYKDTRAYAFLPSPVCHGKASNRSFPCNPHDSGCITSRNPSSYITAIRMEKTRKGYRRSADSPIEMMAVSKESSGR